MSNEQQENYQAMMMSNQNQLVNPSFIQIRLDTKPLLTDIETFLSARKTIAIQNKDGSMSERVELTGTPLANPEGINGLLNTIRMSMLNESIVQGNLMRDEYQMLMCNSRKELTEEVVKKSYEWEIKGSDLNRIIDNIMRLFKLFISRVINNEERKSYMQQFVSRESFTQGKKEPMLKNFAQGIGK